MIGYIVIFLVMVFICFVIYRMGFDEMIRQHCDICDKEIEQGAFHTRIRVFSEPGIGQKIPDEDIDVCELCMPKNGIRSTIQDWRIRDRLIVFDKDKGKYERVL